MEDEYGMADLRQFINGRSIFQPMAQQPDLLAGRGSLNPVQQYQDLVLVGHQVTDMVPHGGLYPDSAVSVSCGLSRGGCFSGLDLDGGGLAGDGGTGRWPRQETLTLLEIRSRLDSKFKEANQKGPLWDEVSRIMSEEHGYQRSGKKCREKFENLYKYYRKTKDGKAGRQDGKHYRFFRQLEALYGETSSNAAASFSDNHIAGSTFPYNNSLAANVTNQEALQASKSSESLSLSNSCDFDSTSSEDATVDNDDSSEKRRKRKGKKNWKAKIKEFIDSQMRKLMEKQEVWQEKMMRTIEEKEKERLKREEEWKKQEAVRVEREQRFWANERAWIEARDASLMECLKKITGKDVKAYQPCQELIMGRDQHQNRSESLEDGRNLEGDEWPECEVTCLIQIRTSMELRFQEMGCPEEVMWEEIVGRMAFLGYDRSPSMCKNKWDSISQYLLKSSSKKRKEDSRTCCYLTNESMTTGIGSYSCSGNHPWPGTLRHAQSDQSGSPADDGGAMPYWRL